jgi:hypothetical protein
MIHMLQVLCGPARHTIYGIMYDDKTMPSQEVREGVEALIEMWIDHGMLNRRCEMCDAPVIQFLYEDGVTKEQDWAKAQAFGEQLEAEQAQTRLTVMAARKAAKN